MDKTPSVDNDFRLVSYLDSEEYLMLHETTSSGPDDVDKWEIALTPIAYLARFNHALSMVQYDRQPLGDSRLLPLAKGAGPLGWRALKLRELRPVGENGKA